MQVGGTVALTPQGTLALKLAAASKYRVSAQQDFRDTSFRAYDARTDVALVPLYLGARDGLYHAYLEAADSDGLSALATLDVLLDTAPPTVPPFQIKTANAENGYAAQPQATLTVAHCDDIEKIYVREGASESPAPTAAAFDRDCADALKTGIPVTLSAGDGAKELILWTLDRAAQVSPIARHGMVVLDSVAPTLAVSPNSGAFKDAIRIVPTTDAGATVHYTTDLSDPTPASPVLPGELGLFNDATLKLRAFDKAGNASPVLTRQFQIDRNGPILGTIALVDPDGIVNTRAVALNLSAVGASVMAFSDSKAGSCRSDVRPLRHLGHLHFDRRR